MPASSHLFVSSVIHKKQLYPDIFFSYLFFCEVFTSISIRKLANMAKRSIPSLSGSASDNER